MGIDASVIQFLCMAKQRGVDFDELLTVGRQNFYPDRAVLNRVCRVLGVDVDPASVEEEYADRFFHDVLGVKKLITLDASDYEGAEVIQDLNRPISPDLRNRFGVVFDGGSLEHVFNCPQAYKNLMEMVRVGGWFLQQTAANNLLGHGFWQISPELIFRCFTPENGFQLDSVFLKETQLDDRWFQVRDPAQLRGRVELCNRMQTIIFVVAKKIADVEVFAKTPQQSDYAAAWVGEETSHGGVPKKRLNPYVWRERLKFLPKGTRVWINKTVKSLGIRPEFEPYSYRRVHEAQFLRGEFGE